MKAIALGILGSVVFLNLLVAGARAYSPKPDANARIAQLEQQVAELRSQVSPSADERQMMVRDAETGAWRPLEPGEIGDISGRLPSESAAAVEAGIRARMR